MEEDTSRIVPTPAQLRGVAHPTRIKMLGMLRLDGPQTATALAIRLGLNTGATSYHLRQLARHGFVVEAEELGTGRDRWWRAAHRSTTLEDVAVEGAGPYLQTVVVRHAQMLQAGVEEFDELPEEWKRATTHSDWVITCSPSRAKELLEQIAALLAQVQDEADDEGAEQVMFQLHAFPRPGRVPHDGDDQ